jgi:hypothetical protein
MPLYMDVHENMENVSKESLEEAHQKDLAIQGKHGVDFKTYWYSEKEGKVFCLVEAPNAEAAKAVHEEAHGKGPDKIVEVKEGH